MAAESNDGQGAVWIEPCWPKRSPDSFRLMKEPGSQQHQNVRSSSRQTLPSLQNIRYINAATAVLYFRDARSSVTRLISDADRGEPLLKIPFLSGLSRAS